MTYNRDAIFNSGNGYCPNCGKKLSRNMSQRNRHGSWEVDHSHPRVQDGTDIPSNLNGLCSKCNMEKGDKFRSLSEFKNTYTPVTRGGKMIDRLNKFKNDDSLLYSFPDLPGDFLGADRHRKKRK